MHNHLLRACWAFAVWAPQGYGQPAAQPPNCIAVNDVYHWKSAVEFPRGLSPFFLNDSRFWVGEVESDIGER